MTPLVTKRPSFLTPLIHKIFKKLQLPNVLIPKRRCIYVLLAVSNVQRCYTCSRPYNETPLFRVIQSLWQHLILDALLRTPRPDQTG